MICGEPRAGGAASSCPIGSGHKHEWILRIGALCRDLEPGRVWKFGIRSSLACQGPHDRRLDSNRAGTPRTGAVDIKECSPRKARPGTDSDRTWMLFPEEPSEEIKADPGRCWIVVEPTDQALAPHIGFNCDTKRQGFELLGRKPSVLGQDHERRVLDARLEVFAGRIEIWLRIPPEVLQQLGDTRRLPLLRARCSRGTDRLSQNAVGKTGPRANVRASLLHVEGKVHRPPEPRE